MQIMTSEINPILHVQCNIAHYHQKYTMYNRIELNNSDEHCQSYTVTSFSQSYPTLALFLE